MKTGRIYFNCLSCLGKKCLYLCRIKLTVNDIILFCKKEDKIGASEIYLAVAMILKTVKLCIVAVTVSNLYRHSAVDIVLKYTESVRVLKIGAASDIFHSRRKRCLLFKRFEQSLKIIPLKNLAVCGKLRIRNLFDLHDIFSFSVMLSAVIYLF